MADKTKECRLQKFLAECGLGSRRSCEQLISDGQVFLNDAVVSGQGVNVRPGIDVVKVDGKVVSAQKKTYIILNKPRDVLCTSKDTHGRQTFGDYLEEPDVRLYCVGRLDRDSDGLLLVTNDGEWCQKVMHPRYHVEKTYKVWVNGRLTREQTKQMRRGIRSDADVLKAKHVGLTSSGKRRCIYEVVLKEGRKRQIRRMFAAVGLDVFRLQRVSIGPIRLGRLRPGQWRDLKPGEVAALEKRGK